MPSPNGPAVERRQSRSAPRKVRERPEPDEPVRVVEVAKPTEYGHSDRLLALGKRSLEEPGEDCPLPRAQRVLPELDDHSLGLSRSTISHDDRPRPGADRAPRDDRRSLRGKGDPPRLVGRHHVAGAEALGVPIPAPTIATRGSSRGESRRSTSRSARCADAVGASRSATGGDGPVDERLQLPDLLL